MELRKLRSMTLRAVVFIIIGLLTITGVVKLYVYSIVNNLVYNQPKSEIKVYDQSDLCVWLIVPDLISIHKSLDDALLPADARHEVLASDIYRFNARRRAWHALEAYKERSEQSRHYLESISSRKRR